MKELLLKKGWHVEIESYENDGDYEATKNVIVETKEKALALYNFCKDLFHSENYSIRNKSNLSCYGLGNVSDEDNMDEYRKIIVDYMKEHMILFNKDGWLDDGDECLFDCADELYNDLFGCSDFYLWRAFRKGKVFYIDEDIYIDNVVLTEN